ncbi:MAG: AAA family ATPase [Deltaproteobacteria bacterium]|nr:AAA family ATPase [Deltaproteobacteria bacterium]
MTITIAMAGKGGTGKTSLASLIIRYLLRHNAVPILAVDADANANLAWSLGLTVKQTIGSVLADFNDVKMGIPPGMTKEAYLNLKLNGAVVESKNVDLLTMGRGEGAGCYCFPNNVLKEFIDKLAVNYRFLVMDNEAGLEHLSRRTTENVDELIIVSNHSVKGVRTIGNILDLIKELKLNVKRQSIVINQAPGPLDPMIVAGLEELGVGADAVIPMDSLIADYDLQQKPLTDLPDTSPAVRAVDGLMEKLLATRRADRERG